MTSDLLHAFPGQLPDEPVFVFARPYPLAFLPTASIFALLFALTIGGQISLASGFFALPADAVNAGLAILGAFQLFVIIVFFIAVFDFYFDIIIVTSRRLVDIDQEQLFFRRINELGIDGVEDVSSQQKGFLQTVFNYGMVEIQTAGTRPNFLVQNIYRPREVTAIILNLSEQAKSEVAAPARFPKSQVVGVINNQMAADVTELTALGAYPTNAT